ncbi:hypothetical protein GBZ26_03570 [Azospirillum formosense]|uniref:DprA winged helix domain-containing protein n=1 Tax=Azospirillum formosense TaxID=861533 RepID=A0ABX2KNX6_9PROT|nr:hypothetical protein [Azospirillum formosense]MBY3754445.1 hypothetical protein [Azospirillum formosense]NUB18306.1 hypothetical protein [Azospirillum formosense]
MSEEAYRALADDIRDAVAAGRWDEADADLDTLAEEAALCLVQDRATDLAALAREVARCHTALALREDRSPEAMHRLGQLRAIAALVAAGRANRPARREDALTRDGTPTAAVLRALEDGAKSGPALVEATGLSHDAVARALPELRAAGLVRSWPAGRLVMNERTGEAG